MSQPLFHNMIPVPVCEYCAAGDVANDDTASVAVLILSSESNDLSEYLCLLHARLLAPSTMRTLEVIEPSSFDCAPARYGVRGSVLSVQFLPVGPVPTTDDGWTSGHGETHFLSGAPRKYCTTCGHYDGWHDGACDSLF